jgi:hypothetical protein
MELILKLWDDDACFVDIPRDRASVAWNLPLE